MDKKKTNFGGLSYALLRENLKQQWYVPALLFILYFLSGIFPILMMEKESRGYYAVTSLANDNVFFGMFIVFIPMVTACIMMRYYHRADMAFALNSQPYARGKLFNTNILTGWLFLVVPVVLTGLIYMAVSGSIEYAVYEKGILEWVKAYTAKDTLIWVINSISLYTFYYGLCVLAGSLVGNTAVQILGSLVFYLVVPALAGIVLLFSEYCLPGYSSSEIIPRLIIYSQPLIAELLNDMFAGSNVLLPDMKWYLAAGILLLLAAKLVCNKAKLEKVGDSMIFRQAESAAAVVITFIGGSVLGILFGYVFNDSLGMFLLGAILGASISFFLVKIILARSIRIFNRRNLRTFITALVIVILFTTAFVLDITGFGGRVPEDSSITSVNVKFVSENILMLNNYGVYDDGGEYIKDEVFTEDRTFIDKVTELHRYIADNRLYDIGDDEDVPSMEVGFQYILSNGKPFERFFNIRVDEKAEELLRDIANHKAVNELMLLPEALKNGVLRADMDIQIRGNDDEFRYYYGDIPAGGKEDIIRFIDVYNEERKKKVITEVTYRYEEDDYDEAFEKEENEPVYAYMRLYYRATEKNKNDRDHYEDYEPCISVSIGYDDKETLELVKALCKKYPADY